MSHAPDTVACRHRPARRRASSALRIVFATVLLGLTTPALAIDYIVEIVLFENLREQSPGGGGLWVPKRVSAVSLGGERAAAQGIVPSDAPLALVDSAAAMTSSGRYRVLQHFSWQQPGLAKREAVRLRIALGRTLEVFVADDHAGAGDFLAAAAAPRPDRPVSMRTFTVAGTLELSLGRFLHLDSTLAFTDLEAGRSYRLKESRKMRSRELHYIDNPRFGILTRIVPVEDAEPAPGEEADPLPGDDQAVDEVEVTSGADLGGSTVPN